MIFEINTQFIAPSFADIFYNNSFKNGFLPIVLNPTIVDQLFDELEQHQAETEGLDRIFIEAGFEWRHPGCSMCLAMNDDRLEPGERCASTSNRNFEGRQGQGGRTHLVSPAMAAAAAIYGHFVDVRSLDRT